jgi:hypothetical protein
MPILLRFSGSGFTADKYAQTVKQLEDAGEGSPAGRLYHVCFGDKENLRVSDIWESREAFEKFSQTLKPIMDGLGVTGDVEFIEIHNIIEGAKASSTAT